MPNDLTCVRCGREVTLIHRFERREDEGAGVRVIRECDGCGDFSSVWISEREHAARA